MKKLMARLPKLNRGQKILRNIIISLVLMILLYVGAGFPVFSAEGAYRRLEKQYLMGPSEIVDKIECPNEQKIVIGTYRNNILLGNIYKNGRQFNGVNLFTVERSDDLTLVPISAYVKASPQKSTSRLLVFDKIPEAKRAEMVLSMKVDFVVNGDPVYFDESYKSTSSREKDGLFYFDIESKFNRTNYEDLEKTAFEYFHWLSNEWLNSRELDCTVNLSFYDIDGKMIKHIIRTLTE